MQAVVKTGGKQYKVAPGEVIRVERLNAEPGTEFELSEVLMVIDGDQVSVGQPVLENASVKVKLLEHGKATKVVVFKKKRRKGYRVKKGHRQQFSTIEIREVTV